MSNFRVTNAGSIMTRTGVLRKSGEEITAEEVGSAAAELLRDGKIVDAGVRVVVGEASSAPQESALIMDASGNLIERPSTKVAVRSAIPPANPTRATRQGELTGIWTCPVNTIQNKSLEELNAMVLERDPKIQPFETREEAIAQLSQDVKPEPTPYYPYPHGQPARRP